jgi:hypothetical protein
MIDGMEIIGAAHDYDASIAGIKQRIAVLGIPYRIIDELALLPSGFTGKTLGDSQVKQLSWRSFLAMTQTVGLTTLFVVDPKLVEQMRPHWERGEVNKIHTSKLARIGKATMNRVFPVVIKEFARSGGKARMARMTAKQRQQFASAGGRASGRARLRKGLMEAARKASTS